MKYLKILLLAVVLSSAIHAENRLIVNDTTVSSGDTVWVTIHMENDDEVVSFQFDLDFPETLIYSGVIGWTDRVIDHEVYISMTDSVFRVMAISSTLAAFTGNSGPLVTLGFTTAMEQGTFEVDLINPILGDYNSENILTGYENGTITIAQIDYDGPIWYVSTDGSNEMGDGSNESPFASIQFGIDASQNGDTVLVQPGTYIETINYNGKSIEVGSLTLTTGDTSYISSTIIDGNQVARVVTFNSGEDSTTMLNGFTISNGYSSSITNPDFKGGGIYCQNASPTISNLRVIGNTALYGGGIYLDNSNSNISDVEIISNIGSYDGGGLYLNNCSNVNLERVTITQNSANGEGGNGFGGGIKSWQSGGSIQDVVIHQNQASQYGGGVYLDDSSPELFNVIITNNSASCGGGIYCIALSDPLLSNITLDGNIASANGGGLYIEQAEPRISGSQISNNGAALYGGGVYCSNFANTIDYCEISSNSAAAGAGIYLANNEGTAPQIQNCTIVGNTVTDGDDRSAISGIRGNILNSIIWGNSGGEGAISPPEEGYHTITYSDVQMDVSGVGNINLDPLFLDAEVGDFSLSGESPCIDAGNPDSEFNDPNGTRNDMGAYFYRNAVTSFEVSGNIIIDQIWSSDTVKVVGDVKIDTLVTLTILPGTLVEFQGEFDITVNGTILAEGTNESPIIFDSNHLGLGWHGIRYWLTPLASDSSKFVHCEFRNGYAPDAGGHPDNSGGAILAQGFGKVYISHCLFEDNTVYGEGGAIKLHEAGIVIEDSEFRNNHSYNSGGAIWSQYSDITLKRNTFYANEASYAGGAIVLTNTTGTIVENITLVNNNAQWGGAFLFSGSIDTELKNCVIWGNTSPNGQIRLDSDVADPSFSYCDIEGGSSSFSYNGTYTGAYENNIDLDPLFNNQGGGILDLTVDSPCIDSGDPDLDGDGSTWETDSDDQDPDGTRMDMGAYYFDQSNLTPQISVSPNSLGFTVNTSEGFEQSQMLTISNTGDRPLEVEIYNGSATVTDIDGNIYPTVQIGDQVWMAENLKATHYHDDTAITNVTDNAEWAGLTTEAYCVYNNNASSEVDTFGVLYNWYAATNVAGIAPEGWHVPTDAEFQELEIALGMSQSDADATGHRGNNEGSKLAGNVELWVSGFLVNDPEFGSSGFTAVPGGVRNGSLFTGIGNWAYFWSSSEFDTDNSWTRGLHSFDTYIDRDGDPKLNGYAIRCVKDAVSSLTEWLSTTPVSLTIPPGESSDVTVSVNAEGMESGDYSDMIIITSNDATNNIIDIPVTMNVIPAYSGPVWHVSIEGSDETGNGSEGFPFYSIQYGIDVSQAGDTVLVQPGTYFENINYVGKNIVVGSLAMTTADTAYIPQTIIDGNQSGNVVTFTNGENSNAVISGFTITNGLSTGNGGGINCYNASPRIEYCWVIQNVASNWGGGLCFDQNSQASIENCLIDSNSAGYGGGVFCEINSDIQITDVIIRGNVATSLGGGFYCTAANPYFNRVLVQGNSAPAWGGVYFHGTESTETFMTNVTIVDNWADGGGGLIVSNPTTILTMKNCIIWGNSPNQVQVEGGGLVLTINYSDIQNGWEGLGNFDLDPLFMDALNGDFQLNGDSPCIDSGDPTSALDPDGTRADMGAYFYDQRNDAPQISISPDSLSFTVNTADGFEQSQTLTISNTGLESLEVTFPTYIDTIVMDQDGNIYPTIQIGDQVWMAENLKVSHYRDGTAITNVADATAWTGLTTEASCIYNNNALNEVDTYGALYNWYAATENRIIAPAGWHVPTDAEWTILEIYLSNNGHDGTEGDALKSTTGWDIGGNGTDDYGFSVLPGGYRTDGDGYYQSMGSYGYFWSATETSTFNAWPRYVRTNRSTIFRDARDKKYGASVRCLRDLNRWHTATPTSLSIQPGMSADVTVTVNAVGLDLDEYSDLISISSNDPTNIIIEIPVTMNVIFQDLIPPDVQLDIPDISGGVENGDTLTVTWTAFDNVALDWAKFYFTSNGGASFNLYDSVDANIGQIDWIAPDIISNRCNFAIWVSDSVGNISADTLSGYFAIDDGTSPQISILTPTQTTSIREHDSLFVSWNATDNIGIEWFELWYSNEPSEPFESLAQISGDDTTFAFEIGDGVSDSARIKMDVMDVAGNLAEDYSEYFSITDNTSPVISYFLIPDTVEWGIGSVMDIGVIASDNVEVTGLDLYYSTDDGATWLPIVEDLYPVQGRPTYSWLIPDAPGECQVQAVVTDAVGLTATAYSDVFSIVIEYPRLIASLPKIKPNGDIYIRFSQLMDSLDISAGAQVVGSVKGSYEIEGELSGYDVTISTPNGFASLDTLTLILTSSAWTNRYGYALDGNRDGVYEGNSIDNDTSYTFVSAAGDFDQNGILDFDDFDDFVIAWHNNVSDYELAPHLGEIPYISIQPDSLFNIFDLATFASMWNWAAGISLSAPVTESFSYEEFISEQQGNDLSVVLPRSEFLASQTIIKYDPNLVQIVVADKGLAKVSSSALSFVDVNPDSGFILITSSDLSESIDNQLKLTLIPSTKQRYSIEVAFQVSDMDANVVQKRTLVELLPIPTSFSLSQNYPNPFNANTSIEYGLPKDSDLSISIYDIRGRFVRDIYSGEQQAGYHLTQWNGTNDGGQNVASGLYFIVLHTPEYRMARKALILK